MSDKDPNLLIFVAKKKRDAFDEIVIFFKGIFYLFYIPFKIIQFIAEGIGLTRSENARKKEKQELDARLSKPLETEAVRESVKSAISTAAYPTFLEFRQSVETAIFDECYKRYSAMPSEKIFVEMEVVAAVLYDQENLRATEPVAEVQSNPIEAARYRDLLIAQQKKARDPKLTLDTMQSACVMSSMALVKHLPPMALVDDDEPETAWAVPLVDIIPNVGQAVWDMVLPYFDPKVIDLGLFSAFRAQFDANVKVASKGGKEIFPDRAAGSPREIVATYLRNTQLREIFDQPVPFQLEAPSRLEHFHLIGGTGHGKSQVIQSLFMQDISSPEPPALIIIDSQQDMLAKMQRLAVFNDQLKDRLVIIDPEFNPALNMFDMSAERLQGYSTTIREQVEAGIIEVYNYIFGSIASELTSKQNVAFSFVVRLMLATPHATLHTLLQLMEDDAKTLDASPFAAHVAKLDRTAQTFFRNQFFNKNAFGATRQQIARRLYSVLAVPAFDRMFSSPIKRLDMFECLQSQKIVLVNTAKALLKSDASALFGRYMIAQAMSAAFERVAIPESERKPAYLVIDEASEYFDESIESLLIQARKMKLGVLFAHQAMSQMSGSLQSVVAANTSIKMAGGVSDRDARTLAPDMRTTADFITGMQKQKDGTQFAIHVRNKTPTAVRLDINFGALESAPQMSAAQHAAMIERNRERYSAQPNFAPAPVAEEPEPIIAPPPSGVPETEIPSPAKKEW